MKRIALLVLAALHLPLIALHLAFPLLFDWGQQFAGLSPINQGIFWCLHIVAIYILALMGVATLLLARPGRALQGLDRGLLAAMAGFYLIRTALELPLFGLSGRGLALMGLCGGMAATYLLAALPRPGFFLRAAR